MCHAFSQCNLCRPGRCNNPSEQTEVERAMTLDHVSLHVGDLARSRAFYTTALAPLGIAVLMEGGDAAGFGKDCTPQFWLSPGGRSGPVHVAFVAANRAEVRAF